MSSTRATITESVSVQIASTAPVGGVANNDGGAGTPVAEDWTLGTGTRQFNRAGTYTFTIAPSGTQLIDLKADLGLDKAALNLIEVRMIRIQADETNTSKITIEPDATDGWLGWMDTASQKVDIGVGETQSFTAPIDGSKAAVSASAKELLITNTDGSDSAIVRVEIIGTDA